MSLEITACWDVGAHVQAFDDEAKWAIEYFREGDEIRGLGVDVEDEVRRFYETFRELVQEVRSPRQAEDKRLLEEIYTAVPGVPPAGGESVERSGEDVEPKEGSASEADEES